MQSLVRDVLPALAVGGLSVAVLFLASLVAAPVVLGLGVFDGLKRLICARPWSHVTLL